MSQELWETCEYVEMGIQFPSVLLLIEVREGLGTGGVIALDSQGS